MTIPRTLWGIAIEWVAWVLVGAALALGLRALRPAMEESAMGYYFLLAWGGICIGIVIGLMLACLFGAAAERRGTEG